ncbi:flagellar hook capping FlgD N-terminal domain-containing protein [Actinokineospora auranticolor]|uniref:Flagellar basal-body rod modification protein FlgD n=1 Tax=Actinokineospora auranticolor TaxID=155976 RepID=A0A2S6GMM2_9PSEU|nr:flagellar hook capping FlgD N-terminal domain-containing protein [Actinokineospora auranticolor]PPK66484.1 flagellar basal-body rod modification protein FlgD [Actinokineospora auranticolor]
MTTPISGSTSNSAAGQSKTTTTNPLTSLDSQAFLKLLVAQLRYQDPSSPTDPTAFMQQTATLTQVEKLTNLADAQTSLLTSTLSAQASALVGKSVTYKTSIDGATQTGTVTSATFGASPTVRIGTSDVPLSMVTGQREAA